MCVFVCVCVCVCARAHVMWQSDALAEVYAVL